MTKRKPLWIAILTTVFFLSGASALTYQIVWQRYLFAGFGLDLTSVSLIVSCFMLGLGVGAYLGGVLADAKRLNSIYLFSAFELIIGIFGLFSPKLISVVIDYLSSSGPIVIGIATFCLLLIPTTLMGATLPLLTAFLTRAKFGSVGSAIGHLYIANTLGAATGCVLIALVLVNIFNLGTSLYIAAFTNFVACAASLYLARVGWSAKV
jgi:predicted membrane-bound spermidine synthase